MKQFDIPAYYRSPLISRIKNSRKEIDPRKKDYSPTIIDAGPICFIVARHFGFCYGVENAIEIAYKTIEENPGKQIFLLSEMIHNPGVNNDLLQRGVKFIMDTSGNYLIDRKQLTKDDIVIIPAFGTTLEIEKFLNDAGIDPYRYNTTCPFVEKVWNRSTQLGTEDYTVIVHGKHYHEETRATFSHSQASAKTVIVRDLSEAQILCEIILGERNEAEFYDVFALKYSPEFDVEKDLMKVGVVNQTTMLASETQAIADLFKNTMIKKYGRENLKDHFADTRDTLCYATNDNQDATYSMLEEEADIAIIVGGYNSSNTSHIVELCEEKLPSFFISGPDKIISESSINHFDLHSKQEITTDSFLPKKDKVRIMLTSGASCPDSVVESVLRKLHSYFPGANELERSVDNSLSLHA